MSAADLTYPPNSQSAPVARPAMAVPAWVKALPFFGMHLAVISVFFATVTPVDWLMCFAFYVIRMFGITAVYHRYFAHKSYKTSRWFQFVLAWIGCSSLQKGPLWWAGHHRLHHRFSDTEKDVHSPILESVWYAHVGWVLDTKTEETHWKILPDWSKYPELVWLNYYHWVPGMSLAALVFCISLATGGTGWGGLAAGFFLSTVLLYHGTFLINSMAHLFGNRRYETTDHSRNSLVLAIITLGEGWHNNHHHYQAAARQGFFWWEIDMSYYALKALSMVGLVWDLKQPPKKMLAKNFRTVRDIAPLPKSV